MILDLRNNPGGLLSEAVNISSDFIKSGVVVIQEDGKGNKNEVRATGHASLADINLVVLVNKGSASASEIVAGALHDHKRAILMGSKSFGKGSVQTVVPMDDAAAIKITTARYYTPSRRSIQAEGITPDILLENVKVSAIDKPIVDPLKEADLSGHLQNGKKSDDATKQGGKAAKDTKKEPEKLANSDYQLYEALNLLKGLTILRDKDL
mgnify:CR=1 FL=1